MLRVTEAPVEYADRHEFGPMAGAVKAAAGIQGSMTVLHSVCGCAIAPTHLRSGGPVVDGYYMPIGDTSIGPNDIIKGQNMDLILRRMKALFDSSKGKPRLAFIFTSDAPSIIQEDLSSITRAASRELGIPVIALDTPSFIGGMSKGSELVWCAILDQFASGQKVKRGLNLVGPELMGSKNWPNDIAELVRLLKAADVPVNHVLFRDITVEQLKEIDRAEANYILCGEDFSEFEKQSASHGMRTWGQDLVLPLGMHNTEEWYLTVAREFGNVEKAKSQIGKDMDRVKRIMRMNYNASWVFNCFLGKHIGILGNATFVAALARFAFFDLNIRPVVLGLWGESTTSIKRAEKLLEPLEGLVDFEVLENPSPYAYGQAIKRAGVDFSIGMRQTRTIVESLGIPHLSLGGSYYLNQWNFVPWPYMGMLGTLNLVSEFWSVMERSVYAPIDMWREGEYHSRDEQVAQRKR